VDQIGAIKNVWPNDQYNWVAHIGFKLEEVSVLSSSIFKAQPKSVDAFLEHRLALQKIGKAVIAYRIGTCELPARIDPKKNCMRIILDKMMENFSPYIFKDNRVSFITFNYDRTLEFFLHSALMHRLGISETDAAI
jgi:hypothetical protein